MAVDTTKLRPYKMRNIPQLDPSLVPFLSQEHQAIQNSIGQVVSSLQQLGAAWTTYIPTVTASSGTFTSVAAQGRYLQVGKTVFVNINIQITTLGTAAGAIIASLPVAPNAASVYMLSGREVALAGKMLSGTIFTNPTVAIANYDNSFAGANGFALVVTGVYEAA